MKILKRKTQNPHKNNRTLICKPKCGFYIKIICELFFCYGENRPNISQDDQYRRDRKHDADHINEKETFQNRFSEDAFRISRDKRNDISP